ncbi:MAG: domain S-box protein [Actinomycetia bacterium]|jgi:anti-sigma regulatory factor (Ser/Thr protein kinase)|nr:domain S-box protein [Actinomycetes bacterium]
MSIDDDLVQLRSTRAILEVREAVEAGVARDLQRILLPGRPPQVTGARVSYRHLPAGPAGQAGGTWFDTITLPGSRLAIVIGDVIGIGRPGSAPLEVAIMGQFRTAVRILATQDLRPDRLLRRLGELARQFGEAYVATCLYAVYDPVARICAVANAGHVPPVLVVGGEARPLDVPSGAPIGLEDAYQTAEFEVVDGSRLVLCTEALLGRNGTAALCAVLGPAPEPLEPACDAVLAALVPEKRPQDITLLAVGLDGIPESDVASWGLESEARAVPYARAQTRETLRAWGLGELIEVVELLVSELVTNALKHGAGAIGLRLVRGSALLCEVADDGHELPFVCDAEDTDESGRGMQLVSMLAERWGTHRAESGKVVWFEHLLP